MPDASYLARISMAEWLGGMPDASYLDVTHMHTVSHTHYSSLLHPLRLFTVWLIYMADPYIS